MIRNNILSCLTAAVLLSVSACQQAQSPEGTEREAAGHPAANASQPDGAPVKSDTAGPANESALPTTIDEDVVPTDKSEVVDRRDTMVAGRPSCALEVRYKGELDQPVTWNGEGCRALTIAFVGLARLKSLNRLDALSEETRDDIAQSDGQVLYIEGGFSAALYPLNSARRIYIVPLAD